MLILGLHPLDIAIVMMALAAILLIGVVMSRGVDDEADFFVGGRSLGPILQFFINFGMMTDSSGAPTMSSEVYRAGAAGMWIPFQPLFSTPFYWFTSIWWRRTRLITAPDQFIERFNSKRLATALAWWGIVVMLLGAALGNLISYKVAAALFVKPDSAYTQADRQQIDAFGEYQRLHALYADGHLLAADKLSYDSLNSLYVTGKLPSYISYIKPLPFYICYTLVVTIYVVLGGIKAAAYTDALQGILIIIFSFLLIPIGLSRLGGIAGLHHAVPQYMFKIFGSSALGDSTWYSILAFVLMGTASIGAPMGCGSARNERAIRTGVLAGGFSKRLIMLAWMFCGLMAAGLFPGGVSDPDNTWGILSRALLGPGLLGVMISGVLLGHMPAVGYAAVNFSATFTRNLYQPMFPRRSEQHYMVVARSSIVVVLAMGIVMASFFNGIISLFTTIVAANVFLGAVGVLMLFWRRLTAQAVGITWIVWIVFILLVPWLLPALPGIRTASPLLAQTPPRSVMVNVPATRDDVIAGNAAAVGVPIRKPQVIPPAAVFFESVAHANPNDSTSPMQGVGRFQFENFLLHCLGVPVEHFRTAALKASTWLFDATVPFVLLMSLSYLPRRRSRAKQPFAVSEFADLESAALPHLRGGHALESQSGVAILEVPQIVESVLGSPILDPVTYAHTVMRGNISLTHNPHETPEQERVRLDRFFAKFKTPIGPTAELDELELVTTFTHPKRFDALKLFPNTNWEFTRWTRIDFLGFFGCWGGVLAVLAILWIVLNIGS